MNHNVKRKSLGAFLAAHYPLFGVLLGSFLITISMGTYTNWDAQLEYEAASNVLTSGFPYVTNGLMINQPPLGFYTAAPVLGTFGLSYLNGVGLAAAFGLGCVALVYTLGTVLYGKRTGLAAAALFGLVPWHVYMSRIFLIDNQCLFFSLLFLATGVLAVKRNSEKLVLATGVFFALAFLTKLFAVLALLPLLLIILFHRKEGNFKITAKKALMFVLPSIILQAVWFGGFANQNFFGVYFSSDFTHPVLVADPSAAFLPIIFVKSAGWFLFLAGFLSLALAAAYRNRLGGLLRLDTVCLLSIAAIMGLDMLLVFGFHLTVPYVSAFKYNYTALPFFCLLAGSLADKAGLLIGSMERERKLDWVKPVLAGAGLVLLFASLLESLFFLNAWTGFVAFGVDSVVYYGFVVFSGAMENSSLLFLHYAALVLVLASLVFPSVLHGLKRGWRLK